MLFSSDHEEGLGLSGAAMAQCAGPVSMTIDGEPGGGLDWADRRDGPVTDGHAPLATAVGDPVLDAGARRLNASGLKRLVDVLGAACGLLFLAPVLILIALIIRFEGRGPILFRQRRTGHNGVPFFIYKFRTMRVLEDGATIVQATPADERVTRFGAFLRRSSIDELPQLLNVLKNEMSLVGPRPHALAHDTYYAAVVPGYDLRFLTKPGITGLAQVSGFRGATPNVESMAARVALDLDYIRQWSLTLDARILVRTLLGGPFHPAAY